MNTARTAEIKTRTTAQVKTDAANVYARWGLSLSDAINIFLIKSIEAGGLPFEMREQSAQSRSQALAPAQSPAQPQPAVASAVVAPAPTLPIAAARAIVDEELRAIASGAKHGKHAHV